MLREARDQVYEAMALAATGELHLRREQLAQAARFFDQALAIYRRLENPAGSATQLFNLGNVSLRRGDFQRAAGHFRQALALFRQASYQHGEIETLRALAGALDRLGQPVAARAELAVALQLAAETGNTDQHASVHCDLAESHHAAGEDEQARHHWQQALALYTELGAPEAERVRDRLLPRASVRTPSRDAPR
jgi:tetratricopeptide (TPR) repeat protein